MTADIEEPSWKDVADAVRDEQKRMLRFDDLIRAIKQERVRQDDLWGRKFETRQQAEWLAILGEEFGEIAKAVNEFNAASHKHGIGTPEQHAARERIREEMIHTVAVCFSWMEFGWMTQ